MNIIAFTLTVDNSNNNRNKHYRLKCMTLYASNKVKYTLK